MNLKKILFLTEYYPPVVGGSCNMFAWRFKLYPPDKVLVLTKVENNSQDFDNTLHYLIKRTDLRRRGPKGFEWWGLVWGLIKAGIPLAIQYKVEVIQCGRPFPEGFAGYVIAKLLRKKLVLNSHGDDIALYQNYPVERFLMRLAVRSANFNLANSHFTEMLLQRYGKLESRTGVIHPGFDPTPFQISDFEKVTQLRERLGGHPLLLTVGRLQRRKGQDQVIRALPQILPRFPDLKYIIVGPPVGWPPEFTDTLRDLAQELGISQHVVFVGKVDIQELPIYYKACDLFIMPNRLVPPGDVEGFGIVFLEAGFLEKPVIGGNSGGVSDVVQHGKTGLLVDGYSVSEITQAVVQILSNPEMAKTMGIQGKTFALSMTHENVFKRYQELMINMGL